MYLFHTSDINLAFFLQLFLYISFASLPHLFCTSVCISVHLSQFFYISSASFKYHLRTISVFFQYFFAFIPHFFSMFRYIFCISSALFSHLCLRTLFIYVHVIYLLRCYLSIFRCFIYSLIYVMYLATYDIYHLPTLSTHLCYLFTFSLLTFSTLFHL